MKISQCNDILGKEKGFILAQSLTSAIDFYWVAFTKFENVIEDIEGADGRKEYLLSLRYRLIEVLQEMDAALSKDDIVIKQEQRLPFVLENGLSFLGIEGVELVSILKLDKINLSYQDIQECLLSFGHFVINQLPGNLPNAQGLTGRREVLQAMQRWSKAADATGDNISFLSSRLHDL
jgi:hypothetical protein